MVDPNRFSYVKYDERAVRLQNELKFAFEAIENTLDCGLCSKGRALALCMTALEEAYMWAGKAIRDDQRAFRKVEEQPERKDG